ncbi:hypothetical protein [Pseudoalteromonas piscicida]|uniref:hypothetical protein n=1 Tax=Pseudoalteromonas piscicida TaxID=43662 RepID=UPI001CB805BB|nr:hypothetical protein [Pseudoalteromonas piscicida]
MKKIYLRRARCYALLLLLTAGPASAAQLTDTCKSSAPFTGREIVNKQPICLPSGARTYLSIPGTNSVNSLAITTGHGSGNLNLYSKNGGGQNWTVAIQIQKETVIANVSCLRT